MQYQNVKKGYFVKRLNRFSALVSILGAQELVHVKNTGRLGELLLPGAAVYLQHSLDNPKRKTQWDLIAVESNGQIVNIDSQAPNRVFREFLESGAFRDDIQKIQAESVYEDSRFDFRLELQSSVQFIEVKGVTLLKDNIAYFPDAPTLRGVKHIRGLMRAVEMGYKAAIVFIVQMKEVNAVRPNDKTQAVFGQALRDAARMGVQVFAYDCMVTKESLAVDLPLPVQM